jgi:arginine N-succinyltransferase
MFIVRPIKKSDTEDFIRMAFQARGMTSLPKNRTILEQKVEDSEHAFAAHLEKPGNEKYLFVLENILTGKIGGVCGVDAKTGIDHPLYFYHIEASQDSPLLQPNPIMRIIECRNMPSEIRSLYLLNELRHEGVGRLLSLSRFLFIAAHRHRFEDIIFAEMRGYIDNHGNSPFWEGIGHHFFNMDIDKLNNLRDQGLFVTQEILPSLPIYTSLLPSNVQESIGKVHDNTLPALNMLIQEGFHVTNDVDVVDGGPRLEAKTDEIYEISRSIVDIVGEIIASPIDTPRCIASNNRLDFRSCFANLIKQDSQGVTINSEVAEALQVRIGDKIRYIDTRAFTKESQI